jgi:predicted metalloendopeptidase
MSKKSKKNIKNTNTKNTNTKNTNTRKIRKKKHTRANDNYYYYVNKPWFANNFISKNHYSKSSFTLLEIKIQKQLLNVITNYIFKKTSNNAIQCKRLYNSVNNFNDKNVETHVYSFINQINDFRKIPSHESLYKFLSWSTYNGIITPISIAMVHDNEHHSKFILELGESGTSFSIKEMYISLKNRNIISMYTKFIKSTFDLFFGENNMYCAEDVVSIEHELAIKMFSRGESNQVIKNKLTPIQIRHKCGFDFIEYITALGFRHITNTTKVSISNPEYIKHVFHLMFDKWTTNKWNSYWVFQVLMFVSSFHSKLYSHFFAFFSTKLSGILHAKPRYVFAVNFVSNTMNAIVSRTYIEHYKNVKQRKYVIELIDKIKKAFKERITKNKWLNVDTKEGAIRKVDAMVCAVGYRDKYMEDPTCEFSETDVISNIANITKWETEYVIKQIHKKIPDRSYWLKYEEMNVFDVNAHYNFSTNELTIPNAILQAPFVDLDKNIVYNLAHIGFIIAHEMLHGFDKNGSHFNEKGETHNWFKKEDIQAYNKLQSEVIEQYDIMAKRDHINVNSKLTLSENIADISALHLIEDVLEQYLFEHNIFGNQQDTYFIDLYNNYAKQWRVLLNMKHTTQISSIDTHSLSKYRVNCVLMRSTRFCRIFNIKPGDGMYYGKPMNEIW